jgi:hypothetical protein
VQLRLRVLSTMRETNEHYRAHTAPLSGAHAKADQVRGWQRCFRQWVSHQ